MLLHPRLAQRKERKQEEGTGASGIPTSLHTKPQATGCSPSSWAPRWKTCQGEGPGFFFMIRGSSDHWMWFLKKCYSFRSWLYLIIQHTAKKFQILPKRKLSLGSNVGSKFWECDMPAKAHIHALPKLWEKRQDDMLLRINKGDWREITPISHGSGWNQSSHS